MNIKIKKSSIKSRDFIFLVIYVLTIILNYFSIISGRVLLLFTIGININYIWKFRKSQPIMICAIFALTYWLYMTLYYFNGINYCTYSTFRTFSYTNATLRIAGLFMAFLFWYIKPMEKKLIDSITNRNNVLVWFSCLLIMILIIIHSYRIGGNFSYKSEDVNSSLYEYYFIFALLAFVYAGNVRKKRILLLLNIFYIISMLRLGLRLVVMMNILLIFIEYFENKFNSGIIFWGTVAGFFFMSFWSMLRSGLIKEEIDLMTILGVSKGSLITNQGDVFYTSASQYAQVALGKWNWNFRLKALFAFFENIVLTSSRQLNMGKLNVLLEDMGIKVPGGGFGAMYAYVWLDVFGVIFLAYYIAHFINGISSNKKGEIAKIYGIFLIFTFFRWYAYNLYIIFKMGFWLLIVYYTIYFFDRNIRRKCK